MKRLPPSSIDPADIASSLSVQTDSWMVFQCKLVTPLYGGGVVAGEVDKDMPIRPTAIRGQLRFWWRLLNRDPSKTTAELFNTERKIWGGLGKPSELEASKVKVRVRDVKNISRLPCQQGSNLKWQHWAHPYALFPAQGKKASKNEQQTPPKVLVEPGLCFCLLISLSSKMEQAQKDTVLESIRWWTTFGGVGARTRRGLGAFEVISVEGLSDFRMVTPEEVKEKNMRLVFGETPKQKAIEAWHDAINLLESFRKGKGKKGGTNLQQNLGRGRWPESKVIQQVMKGKQTDRYLFPRAIFGLPIQFKLGESQEKPTLLPLQLSQEQKKQPVDRMASPVILRPYRIQADQWQASMLVLPYTHALRMELHLKTDNQVLIPKISTSDWLPEESNRSGKSTLVQPMGRFSDPIEAFSRFFSGGYEPKISVWPRVDPSPPQPKSAERRIENAQIKLETNGAVSAKFKSEVFYAIGDRAKEIRNTLSDAAKAQIKKGFYRATAIVLDRDLIRVEEPK